MYCDECDVTIPYTTDTCPLCLKKISDSEVLDNPVYPKRNASFRFPMKYSFSLFYSIIAFSTFFIVLLVNLLTDRSVLWAFIVGAGLLYLFALIRHTILTSYGSASKLFVQGVLLSLLILIIQQVTKSGAWAYEYVIPMVLMTNTIALWALALIRRVRRANYVFTLVGIAICNLVPVIWYIAGASSVLWTMIVSASSALITLIIAPTVFHKPLIAELKRLFHL